MKRAIIAIILIIALILPVCAAKAWHDDRARRMSDKRAIFIGYSEDDKEKIFPGLSSDEAQLEMSRIYYKLIYMSEEEIIQYILTKPRKLVISVKLDDKVLDEEYCRSLYP